MCQQAQTEEGHTELRPIILIGLILMKPHVQPKSVNILLLIHQYDTLTITDILSLFEEVSFKGKRFSQFTMTKKFTTQTSPKC